MPSLEAERKKHPKFKEQKFVQFHNLKQFSCWQKYRNINFHNDKAIPCLKREKHLGNKKTKIARIF